MSSAIFLLAYTPSFHKQEKKETINVFLTIKTKTFESPKNGIFPKGLTRATDQKIPIFSLLFLVKTRLEIRFNNVLDGKETVF